MSRQTLPKDQPTAAELDAVFGEQGFVAYLKTQERGTAQVVNLSNEVVGQESWDLPFFADRLREKLRLADAPELQEIHRLRHLEDDESWEPNEAELETLTEWSDHAKWDMLIDFETAGETLTPEQEQWMASLTPAQVQRFLWLHKLVSCALSKHSLLSMFAEWLCKQDGTVPDYMDREWDVRAFRAWQAKRRGAP